MAQKNKVSVYISDENIETLKQIASQEKRSFSSMLDVVISDATSGELIKKSSVRDFIKANPKATGKQILEYFKLS